MARPFHAHLALRWTAAALAMMCLALVAAILWPAREAPVPETGQDRLIHNVRIVDVEHGTAGAPTSVLIRAGRIAAIGPDVEAGRLPIYDAAGGYMIPGLWDMHVHSFQVSPQLHLPLFLANGVTGVRDMMDCPELEDALLACVADKRRWDREAAASRRAGPRFVQVASFYFQRPDLTPADVTRLATAYKARGLDALKVYNRLSRPAYDRLAADSRRLGLPLIGHLPRAVSLDVAIAAGQQSFEHAHLFVRHCFRRAEDWRKGRLQGLSPTQQADAMVRETDDARCARAFAAMRDAGAWFVPTHVTREEDARAEDPTFSDDPHLAYLDPLSRWAWRDDLAATVSQYPGPQGRQALARYFERGLALTGSAHRAGVPILVGTDTILGGFRYHDELGLLVRAGLSPAAVLKAATIDAARYAGAQRDHGTVAAGKLADLVILEADPLANIANTRRIKAVLLCGALYDRPMLDRLLAHVEREAGAPANWAKLVWGFATSSVSSEL